ncbi:MAG: hypothetical protein CO077_01490, partial [Candidatus Nealsonbacteria bacterium CG_4_9_14_0_8_um_filter_35_12]
LAICEEDNFLCKYNLLKISSEITISFGIILKGGLTSFYFITFYFLIKFNLVLSIIAVNSGSKFFS